MDVFVKKYYTFTSLLFLFSVFGSINTASATVLYQSCGRNCVNVSIRYFPHDLLGTPSINFDYVKNKLGQIIKVHIYGSKDTYGISADKTFNGKFYANNSYKGKVIKTANIYLSVLLKDQKLINNVSTITSYFTITNSSSGITFCNYTISSIQNQLLPYTLQGGSYSYNFHITWQNLEPGVSCNTTFIGGGYDLPGKRKATIHVTLD